MDEYITDFRSLSKKGIMFLRGHSLSQEKSVYERTISLRMNILSLEEKTDRLSIINPDSL
ncbi:unnamed protein product [Brassica oleracea]